MNIYGIPAFCFLMLRMQLVTGEMRRARMFLSIKNTHIFIHVCAREKVSALIYSRQFMAELSFSPEQVN